MLMASCGHAALAPSADTAHGFLPFSPAAAACCGYPAFTCEVLETGARKAM